MLTLTSYTTFTLTIHNFTPLITKLYTNSKVIIFVRSGIRAPKLEFRQVYELVFQMMLVRFPEAVSVRLKRYETIFQN